MIHKSFLYRRRRLIDNMSTSTNMPTIDDHVNNQLSQGQLPEDLYASSTSKYVILMVCQRLFHQLLSLRW
jgi:hypothetical protein